MVDGIDIYNDRKVPFAVLPRRVKSGPDQLAERPILHLGTVPFVLDHQSLEKANIHAFITYGFKPL